MSRKIFCIDDSTSAAQRLEFLLKVANKDLGLTGGEEFELVHQSRRADNIAWFNLREVIGKAVPKAIVINLIFECFPSEGIRWLEALQRDYPQIPVLVWSKVADDHRSECLTKGARGVFEKSFEDAKLIQAIVSLP